MVKEKQKSAGKVSSTGGANESEDSVEEKHAEEKTSEGIRVPEHKGRKQVAFQSGYREGDERSKTVEE